MHIDATWDLSIRKLAEQNINKLDVSNPVIINSQHEQLDGADKATEV